MYPFSVRFDDKRTTHFVKYRPIVENALAQLRRMRQGEGEREREIHSSNLRLIGILLMRSCEAMLCGDKDVFCASCTEAREAYLSGMCDRGFTLGCGVHIALVKETRIEYSASSHCCHCHRVAQMRLRMQVCQFFFRHEELLVARGEGDFAMRNYW